MHTRRTAMAAFLAAGFFVAILAAQSPRTTAQSIGTGPIQQTDLERWLTALAADDMEGRVNGTEALVRAGDYLAAQARAVGLQPGGDNGTYFQNFQITGAQTVANRSTLAVTVNGQTRVFRNGEGVEFPQDVGGRRSFTLDQVEFIGYGLDDPSIRHNDFAGKDLRGKAAIYLCGLGPKGATPIASAVLRPAAAAQAGTAALIGWPPTPLVTRGGGEARAPAGAPVVHFTTVRRLDDPLPPPVTVGIDQPEPFYSFLLSGSGVAYADLKAKVTARAPIPSFTLKGVKLTFTLDADYTVVRSAPARNVVGVIPGAEPALANTYVVLGAHYDHIASGVTRPVGGRGPAGVTSRKAAGATARAEAADRIYNGADDNASGSAALLSIAKALANGPRPRRTVVFVWFAAEERGLLGSRYHAAHGPPGDRVAAMLNLDMIGRNQDDKPEAANTVCIVGADRTSTELHNINDEANRSLARPLTLEYRYNDRALEGMMYFASDHYSYAVKNVPVILFSTGRHPDYHRVTDSADKIEFPKLARVTNLVYETTRRLASLDHLPVRDNLGPRAGKGHKGKLPVAK